MAAWVCKGCRTVYSVDAPRCPHCGSKKWVEQGAKGDPTLVAPTEDAVEVEEDLDLDAEDGTDDEVEE